MPPVRLNTIFISSLVNRSVWRLLTQFSLPNPINMSAKAISEATGKSLLVKHLSIPSNVLVKPKYVSINEQTDLHRLPEEHPWLSTEASAKHTVLPKIVIRALLDRASESVTKIISSTVLMSLSICMSVSLLMPLPSCTWRKENEIVVKSDRFLMQIAWTN